jgi:hypothetical protein
MTNTDEEILSYILRLETLRDVVIRCRDIGIEKQKAYDSPEYADLDAKHKKATEALYVLLGKSKQYETAIPTIRKLQFSVEDLTNEQAVARVEVKKHSEVDRVPVIGDMVHYCMDGTRAIAAMVVFIAGGKKLILRLFDESARCGPVLTADYRPKRTEGYWTWRLEGVNGE